MERKLTESEWKTFRELHKVALDRFCERVLSEIAAIAADSRKTHHARYLAVYKRIKQRDKEIADAFNDPARSRAFLQLLLLRRHHLLAEDEFARFRSETCEAIDSWLATGPE